MPHVAYNRDTMHLCGTPQLRSADDDGLAVAVRRRGYVRDEPLETRRLGLQTSNYVLGGKALRTQRLDVRVGRGPHAVSALQSDALLRKDRTETPASEEDRTPAGRSTSPDSAWTYKARAALSALHVP